MALLAESPIADSFEDIMAIEEFRREFDGRLTRVEGQVSEINVSVAKLVQMLDGYQGNQVQMLAMLQRIVGRHAEQLDGFQDQPGHTVRLDRLERTEASRVWHIRTIWAALMAVLAKWVLESFHRP